MQMQDTPGL